MIKIIQRLYSIYGSIIFILTFLVLLPVFAFTIEVSGKKDRGRKLNRIWSRVFFGMLFFKVRMENLHQFKEKGPYVIVANHFSYLDIPVLGLIPFDLIFIGKSSLGKVPLFGYMFKNLHIAVNRNSLKSRGESVQRAKEALDQGSSVVFFPEGGISSSDPPNMARFKEGAFKVAVDKQIPVIPITLSYNHLILPDDGRFLLRYKPVKVVIHPLVSVKGLGIRDVGQLKEKCYRIIQEQLWTDNETLKVKMKSK